MRTALIVEDEPEANQLLSMLVQLRGYRTDSAYTGGEALEMVDRDPPDLVFLDLMLPDSNGLDVCRALKQSRPTSAIPVVMVTARLADENRVQGFRAGATEYVPKPYTPDQIFGAMEEADRWRKGLDQDATEGVIPLDTRADVEPFRQVCRLRTVLLERSRLPEATTQRLHQLLLDLACRALEWGARKGIGLVATLAYRWDEGEVVVAVRDESGWFEVDPPRRTEGIGGLIARGRIDEVAYNEGSHQVVLTCLSPPGP